MEEDSKYEEYSCPLCGQDIEEFEIDIFDNEQMYKCKDNYYDIDLKTTLCNWVGKLNECNKKNKQ
jgi:transposase-like protein